MDASKCVSPQIKDCKLNVLVVWMLSLRELNRVLIPMASTTIHPYPQSSVSVVLLVCYRFELLPR